MHIPTFIEQYRSAFSDKAELPIAFGYSDQPQGEETKTQGCLFKAFPAVRSGAIVSLSGESIGCRGGRFYTGFSPMGEHIPQFVSQKERYKETPEAVLSCIAAMNVPRNERKYLNLARIDRLDSLDETEGLLFLATPDVLTGLCSWIFWDNHEPDAVCTLFGSGCSSTFTLTVAENRRGGTRTFLGLLDPSVRPYIEENVLGLSIPLSRFRTLYETMPECCLLRGTPAWQKVKRRIAGE